MASLTKRFPIYSRLLRLYPTSYKNRYDDQMLQTLADMLDAKPSSAARMAIWTHVTIDLPIHIFQEQLSFVGNTLTHETPAYVRRNSLISLLLFVPFFALVFINDVTAHGLYHSWIWSVNVLFTWILILPAIGLGLSLITFTIWLRNSHSQQHRSWLSSIRDIRHSWSMLALIVVGLGILSLVLLHDSVHCVTGNPLQELHSIKNTLQCIQRG